MNLKPLIITTTLLLASLSSHAETISIAAPVASDIDKPVKGLSKDTVVKKYGEPQDKKAPVGDPPITKWTYSDFTVYFEGDIVIHTVINRK